MLEKKVAMPPTATPIAATVPMSTPLLSFSSFSRFPSLSGPAASFLSSWSFSLVLSAAAVATALSCSFLFPSSSAALARFWICSSTSRMKRLYGAQNAWRMLMGFSTIFVIVACQSSPARS